MWWYDDLTCDTSRASYTDPLGKTFRTDSILVSLLQIVNDPKFRTIDGFLSLLQKDWVRIVGFMKPGCSPTRLLNPLFYLQILYGEEFEGVNGLSTETSFIMFVQLVWYYLVRPTHARVIHTLTEKVNNPTRFEFNQTFLHFIIDDLQHRLSSTFVYLALRRLEANKFGR